MAAQQLQKSKLRPGKGAAKAAEDGGNAGSAALHDGVLPTLPFAWMAVLWQRGFEHKNLHVRGPTCPLPSILIVCVL